MFRITLSVATGIEATYVVYLLQTNGDPITIAITIGCIVFQTLLVLTD